MCAKNGRALIAVDSWPPPIEPVLKKVPTNLFTLFINMKSIIT
jgi:hypothetical protein